MLQFRTITLHNFGSYHHAEIDLQNKGFCLVSGENHHKEDNALSNGAGKSFIWSGICFAITGQTIQGLKTNLKNIYVDEEDAYVTLDFFSDKDHYVIKRSIAPKTDLKIIKNDIDISGKGIRESETKLEELLPDLTQDLISSVIIIGQGMPNKFSAFKPAGRKELLEKLTKSDFMIQDIKERIESRKAALDNQSIALADKMLIIKTNINSIEANLQKAIDKKANSIKPDFEKNISDNESDLKQLEKNSLQIATELKTKEAELEQTRKEYIEAVNNKNTEKNALLENYNNATGTRKLEKTKLETELRLATSALNQIKAHPDVCPTCGQELPNSEHIKEEKIAKENLVKELTAKLDTVKKSLADDELKNNAYTKQINEKHDNIIYKISTKTDNLRNNITNLKKDDSSINQDILAKRSIIAKLTVQQESWDRDQAELEKTISESNKKIEELSKTLKELTEANAELDLHIATIKQLDTLTKRDFRGYILTDIINYLDKKAKDYSEIVFGHRNLNIYLNGNNLDISFMDKMFDNLSGGEKQRVDLITQFAIRDLLVNYLNGNSNILVLDEIFDNLDKISCEAILKLIEKELNTIESVFIISHHVAELPIMIDTELHVTKDASGISTITCK